MPDVASNTLTHDALRERLLPLLAEEGARFGTLLPAVLPVLTDEEAERYLYGPLRDFFGGGGKHLRAILCEQASAMTCGNGEAARNLALAVECFHCAALIHDDVQDKATERHGAPSYNAREGDNLAINAGDYGLAMVFRLVLSDTVLSDRTKLTIIDELITMAQRTIEGQAMDLGWARDGRLDLTPEHYLTMASLKTAYYSWSAPLVLGCIAGGGNHTQVEALRAVGDDAGVAFQIRDDVLNLTAEHAAVGKDCFSDLAEGKRTLIVLHALQVSLHAQELKELLARDVRDTAAVARMLTIIREADSIEYADQVAKTHYRRAVRNLRAAFPTSDARDIIESLIAYGCTREK